MLAHHPKCLVVQERAVFDRVDASPYGAFSAFGSMCVSSGLPPQIVRFTYQRIKFSFAITAGRTASSVGESTPPVAHVLITSAPYFDVEANGKPSLIRRIDHSVLWPHFLFRQSEAEARSVITVSPGCA